MKVLPALQTHDTDPYTVNNNKQIRDYFLSTFALVHALAVWIFEAEAVYGQDSSTFWKVNFKFFSECALSEVATFDIVGTE